MANVSYHPSIVDDDDRHAQIVGVDPDVPLRRRAMPTELRLPGPDGSYDDDNRDTVTNELAYGPCRLSTTGGLWYVANSTTAIGRSHITRIKEYLEANFTLSGDDTDKK